MSRRVRSIYAYQLHGHDAAGPLDYRDFFKQLLMAPSRERVYAFGGGEIIGIPEMIAVTESRYAIRFVIGREGDTALFFDPSTAEEREATPRRGEVAAQTSWLWVDVVQRLMVQERRRPGVPLESVERGLAGIGRELDLARNPTITFMPVVAESFADEIDELGRIRTATVVLQRPNARWTDSVNSLLAAYADDSNVNTVEFGATARPSESLAKDAGIVGDIKQMSEEDFSPLKNARVVGTRPGEANERTVSMSKHAVKREVELPPTRSRDGDDAAVNEAAQSYLDRLGEERGTEQSGGGEFVEP